MTDLGYDLHMMSMALTKPIIMAAEFTKVSVLRATVTQCDSAFPAHRLWYPASRFSKQGPATEFDYNSKGTRGTYGWTDGVDVGRRLRSLEVRRCGSGEVGIVSGRVLVVKIVSEAVPQKKQR